MAKHRVPLVIQTIDAKNVAVPIFGKDEGNTFETLNDARARDAIRGFQRVGVPIFITSERKFYVIPAENEDYVSVVPTLIPGEGITIEDNVINVTHKTLAGKMLDAEASPGMVWVHLFDASGKLTYPPVVRQVNLVEMET